MADQTRKPVQLYRFKVRTADGREMVSAVAVVDPNAEGEGKDDAADSAEELEQKHKEEEKEHGEELAGHHDAEAERHAADLDKHHEDIEAKHDEATDAKHEGEHTKAEAETIAKHGEELDEHKKTLEDKHEAEKEQLHKDLGDKHHDALHELLGGIDKEHVAELAKHAEESGKGFLDNLINKGKELAQQHAGDDDGHGEQQEQQRGPSGVLKLAEEQASANQADDDIERRPNAKGPGQAESGAGGERAQPTHRPDQTAGERHPKDGAREAAETLEQTDDEGEEEVCGGDVEDADLLVFQRDVLGRSKPGSPGKHGDQRIQYSQHVFL